VLGAVHGDDAEVLRPDGLNAWAEQAVGLVQNQGLVALLERAVRERGMAFSFRLQGLSNP